MQASQDCKPWNVLHLQCGIALQQELKRISNCKIRGASLQSQRRICGQCAGWGDCDEEAQCHTHRLLLRSHLLPSDWTKWINAIIDAQDMIQRETLKFHVEVSALIRVILSLNEIFYLELVPYNLPLVVLHTISIDSFHLWSMLGGRDWIWMKRDILVHWGPNSF